MYQCLVYTYLSLILNGDDLAAFQVVAPVDLVVQADQVVPAEAAVVVVLVPEFVVEQLGNFAAWPWFVVSVVVLSSVVTAPPVWGGNC